MKTELDSQRNLSTQMKAELDAQHLLTTKLTSDVNNLKKIGHGNTYVRWGRKSCPDNATEQVYSGFAGGAWFEDPGGAANYICLSSDPQWHSTETTHGYGRVFGAEYHETFAGSVGGSNDVPCCVCRPMVRSSTLMIPGRTTCYPGWHTEYQGYLATGRYDHKAASEYVCMDKNPEVLQHGLADEDDCGFYDVGGRCGSLPCPPYVEGRRIACVVCTK